MKKLFATIALLLFTTTFMNAQRNPMYVGVGPLITIPIGEFNNTTSMGLGIKGNFIYRISKKFEATGSIGYISWGPDKTTIATTTVEATESTTAIPILIGTRFYFPQKNLMPYALIEFGVNIFTFPPTTTVIAGTEDKNAATKVDTTVDFGYALGGGATYEISDGFKVDGSLKYNIINSGKSNPHITMQIGFLIGIN